MAVRGVWLPDPYTTAIWSTMCATALVRKCLRAWDEGRNQLLVLVCDDGLPFKPRIRHEQKAERLSGCGAIRVRQRRRGRCRAAGGRRSQTRAERQTEMMFGCSTSVSMYVYLFVRGRP